MTQTPANQITEPVEADAPVAAPGERTILHVDRTDDKGVFGWAWDPDDEATRQTVEILLNGKVIGTAVADQNRPDLTENGHGDGHYGFSWHFDGQYQDVQRSLFSVRLVGTEKVSIDLTQPVSIRQIGSVVKMLNDHQGQLTRLLKQVKKLTKAGQVADTNAKDDRERLRKDIAMLESLLIKWDRQKEADADTPIPQLTLPWLRVFMVGLAGGLLGALIGILLFG